MALLLHRVSLPSHFVGTDAGHDDRHAGPPAASSYRVGAAALQRTGEVYLEYPVTSTTRWTPPPRRSVWTAKLPSGSPVRERMPLFVRTCPALKLIAEVPAAKPLGPSRRSSNLPAATTE